ncbi:PRC-barrel domain-containing protein [Cellulomonas sp. Y8]|uniref:PRC-barrel domain-containing protein n=1 Tax=Cellulomonas sp. Y8 TaxID=2591145 RepID=UPI003D764EC6
MILSDLLDAPVRAADGTPLGWVVDARFVLDGPVDPPGAGGGVLAVPRLHGLLVSPRTSTSFLGYERTDVRAPWPVAHWLRRRHRGTFLAHWADVASVDADGVALVAGARRYDPALPGPTHRRPAEPER